MYKKRKNAFNSGENSFEDKEESEVIEIMEFSLELLKEKCFEEFNL